MSLAKELLVKGQADPVLDYLAKCAELRWSGGDRLSLWSGEINSGRIPAFPAVSLFY
jgi:hypothetical protein